MTEVSANTTGRDINGGGPAHYGPGIKEFVGKESHGQDYEPDLFWVKPVDGSSPSAREGALLFVIC